MLYILSTLVILSMLNHHFNSRGRESVMALGHNILYISSSIIVFYISLLLFFFAFINLFLPLVPIPFAISHPGAFLKLLH